MTEKASKPTRMQRFDEHSATGLARSAIFPGAPRDGVSVRLTRSHRAMSWPLVIDAEPLREVRAAGGGQADDLGGAVA